MNYLQKTTGHNIVLEEEVIFEKSRKGGYGIGLPKLDVPKIDHKLLYNKVTRKNKARLPELSEPEVVRHFTRLSTWNYAIDLGIYPLGSCTMKHNPRLNEEVARSASICELHPYDPIEWSQGHLQIMYELQEDLQEITGMPAVSLQPSAGAQGEFTGLLLISAYHRNKGKQKKTIITADTSHGTNPASAALAGYNIVQIQTGSDGSVSLDSVQAVLNDDVAAMMITNPNTLGIFEKNIKDIAKALHDKDALLYIDGANMNAVLGLSRPGDYGADVIQFNLHKTFTTPHGGGGPGSGPIAVSAKLEPFLPIPRVEVQDGKYNLNYNFSKTIGRVKAFYGNYGMFIRAWCYIKALGRDGLKNVSENAILNANYIKSQLKDVLNIPVEGNHLHEVVFNDKNQKESGWDTTKIAKALIDYGMHPPTVHFPLCVKNALMVEPTETESIDELDRFINAIKEVVTLQDSAQSYPKKAFREKVDEVKAARELKLTYKFKE
ncbi:aminomethyl-transferring glycine dehydrogenase subunit GcvPB [Pigmentibacter sp. JX0631]|uniref:aminomethyl-transferring glycine dehydrogenase subunit GcvPB n=1 Tax=Pigmentibacter sp. JX0631 TaxID=2976982 RepID=UPI0024690E28|nr:aminomethyl-transferring glycine dehydrogenase subunit GcvPB [Pigmentibacter sp. JX0631]WGL61283.1 aminomethyl-transferring glycine dehydrogenase subunit GcvPB [Pigmentibacter sp. JX0631]